jgi:hypothetical protein
MGEKSLGPQGVAPRKSRRGVAPLAHSPRYGSAGRAFLHAFRMRNALRVQVRQRFHPSLWGKDARILNRAKNVRAALHSGK